MPSAAATCLCDIPRSAIAPRSLFVFIFFTSLRNLLSYLDGITGAVTCQVIFFLISEKFMVQLKHNKLQNSVKLG
nr:MAG TPA: hypothetical protein [Caudoviricetes sp.]